MQKARKAARVGREAFLHLQAFHLLMFLPRREERKRRMLLRSRKVH
jgi:hypothetical protein